MPGNRNKNLTGHLEGKQSQAKKLLILGLLSVSFLILNGCSSRFEDDNTQKKRDDMQVARYNAAEVTKRVVKEKRPDPIKSIVSGKQLFVDFCIACHGENAKGVVGPDLTVSKFKYGKDRLNITKSISQGRPGGMPAFNSQMNMQQVEALVEYVLSLK